MSMECSGWQTLWRLCRYQVAFLKIICGMLQNETSSPAISFFIGHRKDQAWALSSVTQRVINWTSILRCLTYVQLLCSSFDRKARFSDWNLWCGFLLFSLLVAQFSVRSLPLVVRFGIDPSWIICRFIVATYLCLFSFRLSILPVLLMLLWSFVRFRILLSANPGSAGKVLDEHLSRHWFV